MNSMMGSRELVPWFSIREGKKMAQENHGIRYWKEVGLVVLGAVMASIPTLTVAYIHEKNEVHRLVVDRQITAIKDFAACTNKAATQVLPDIEENDEKI